jgi:hypothetical protein
MADRAVRPQDRLNVLESGFFVVKVGAGQNGHGGILSDWNPYPITDWVCQVYNRQLADLLDTDPITLKEASQLVLRGVVSVSALRAEIKRGNLVVERIGKNLFTTPAAIREMRVKCRVEIQSRPSPTDDAANELAALNASLKALRSVSIKGRR